ncbi:Ig-like domain-containing protein [Bacillus sp. MRMR6]|uniref:rhamnogalacturonan lyase family protein n=1 Tax=Bacillus sp. MRMR6 TaxID=1928617 RepID=UPI000950BE00|nr:Ig-like domain-containing protein [Bacillus sp. MRMR6]OLS34846.1 hypothetical protein BTR25_21015 [Bacillus sp. MRMR6]
MRKRNNKILSILLTFFVMCYSVLPFIGTGTNRVFAEQLAWKYDFGTGSSLVADGYTRVSESTIYTSDSGFGLNKKIASRDRSYSDALLRDFVLDTSSAKNYTFRADVPNGTYQVKVGAGDAIASNKTSVSVEAVELGATNTGSGEFEELTGTIKVIDGKMLFTITGNDTRINVIEITQLEQNGETIKIEQITVNGTGGTEEVLVGESLQMQTTLSPENASYPWLTWNVYETDGTETGLASIDSNGVLTANFPGKVKIVASSMDGSEVKGEKIINLKPTNKPNLKFDFGTSSSSLQTGFARVTEATHYSPEIGYGLDQTVVSRDRSHSDNLLRDFVLLQGSQDYTFEVDLPNGSYDVKVLAGDAIASNQTTISVQDVDLGTMNSSSGNFAELTGKAEVTDRKMTFTVGGNDRRINGIEITPVQLNNETVQASAVLVGGVNGKSIVNEGEKLQMTANVIPAFAKDRSVTWSVFDLNGNPTELAEISPYGLLSAKHWGQVKVIATTEDGTNISGETVLTIHTNRTIGAPDGLTLTEQNLFPESSVSLRWNKVEEAIGYNVYRKLSGEKDYQKVGNSVSTDFTDENALPGMTYSYVVTALIEGIGNTESEFSSELIVKMYVENIAVPSSPKRLKNVDATRHSIELAWESPDSAKLYYIYRSDKKDGTFVQTGESKATSFIDNDVLTDVPYYYKVKAVNEGGLSEFSDVLEVPIATYYYRQMEKLNRGLIAVKADNGIYIGWRLLGTDPKDIAFNLYRDGKKINSEPIKNSTNFLDSDGTVKSIYKIRVVADGKTLAGSESTKVKSNQYFDLPLQKPANGVTPKGDRYSYNANDASAADLDGDGEYELILKWDPENSKDNSRTGYTGNVYVDAYKMNGELLWRIDLGKNIRAGAHYTQFMVYDLDGDGKAEVAMRTSDGSVDAAGKVIGDPNADHRDTAGRIYRGPEFLTIFDGMTGKELVSTEYEPKRGSTSDWGDGTGNRSERFLAGVAYLDGERPSLIMARGYYAKSAIAAYNWRDGELTKLWKFDTSDPGNSSYRGQGNHNLSVGDVDGDGKDEIVYGAMTLDHDGSPLYNSGFGHGDAMHLGDLDPERPGLEVFSVFENGSSPYGLAMRDAATGEVIWGKKTGRDTGRGLSANIDPRYPGEQAWAIGGEWNDTNGYLFSAKGEPISNNIPPANFAIWWDGDLLRELLDHNFDGTNGVGTISKWDYENEKIINLLTADGTFSNNGTKGTPVLQADLFGDWREEAIWRLEDSSALRIYTTTVVTEHRIHTLMHDPIYRLGIAWQNVAYNQPPHTSFYLGHGMAEPPVPKILTGPRLVDKGIIHVLAHQEGEKAVVNISAEEMSLAAQSMEGNHIVVKVNGGSELNKFDVAVPSQSIKAAEGTSVKRITFSTNLGSVTIDVNELSKKISKESKKLVFTMSTVPNDTSDGNPVYDFSLMLDGKQLTDVTHSNGNVIEVEVPYNLKSGESNSNITIYYLTDQGEITEIKNARYNQQEGTATFKLKQF